MAMRKLFVVMAVPYATGRAKAKGDFMRCARDGWLGRIAQVRDINLTQHDASTLFSFGFHR
jgi:hypothetical protein